MDNVTAPAQDAQTVEDEQGSLAEELRELSKDARALAEAEFAYQKSRANYAGKESAKIALLALIAGALIFFAVMALVVGSVIALGPALGAWGATAAVMGALVVIALACVLGAFAKFRQMRSIISEKEGS